MHFSAIGLASVLSLIAVATLDAQSAVRELQDLVGARVIDVTSELEKRGYERAGVERATEFWRKSSQCVRLGLGDGRVVRVVTANVTECDKVAANKPKVATNKPTAPPPTPALATQRANPASEHCVQQRGTHRAEKRPDGGAFGVCVFEDNRQCEEWAFLRGQCPAGGVRITGYATEAARYCAITGGRYTVTAKGAAPVEQGSCTLPDGTSCEAEAYFRGSCSAASPAATSPAPTSGRVAASWLDRPLTNWNSAGQVVPRAPRPEEPLDAVASRCRVTKSGSTANERAVAAAGWIPFRPGGKQLVRNDVEVVGGMAGADGMCRPNQYNVFVFVAGRYAGSVSPTVMTSRLDGASGAIVVMRDTLTSEFLRYTDADPLCCPSSRVSASYRIDRSGQAPLLAPLGVSPVRSN